MGDTLLTTPRFTVERVAVPDRRGRLRDRYIVAAPDAVVVLPLLPGDRLVLVQNERPAVGRHLLELPAGVVEPGESPEDTALRELTEETGYRAGRIERLLRFFPSPGFLTERMHAFRAEDLEQASPAPRDDENLSVVVMPLADVLAGIREGLIEDGKTIATILYYVREVRGT